MTNPLKLSLAAILLLTVIATTYLTIFQGDDIMVKVGQTAAIFFIAILIDVLFEKFMVKRISVSKARFIISKTISYLTYVVALALSLGIWIEQATNLLFAFGVVGAGVAIALQKPITNIVGFITILTTNPYAPGDRIEIAKERGDVIDIELFHTKIMEVGEWAIYDQFTGRIVNIPNFFVLEKMIKNYSKDFGFIWEEIMMPVTYGSDWREARSIMLEVAKKHTMNEIDKGSRQLKKMTYKYLLEPREVEPAVYMVPTDNWIELRLRFIVNAHHRRSSVNPVFEDILKRFEKNDGIKISSKTSARIFDSRRTGKEY